MLKKYVQSALHVYIYDLLRVMTIGFTMFRVNIVMKMQEIY